MWLTNPLDDALSSKAKVAILRAVCNTAAPLSGREIARRAGIWPGPASKALRELVASGLLICRHHGRANTYELADTDVALIGKLRELFDAESDRRRQAVSDLVRDVPDILSVFLFGSEARREAKPGSDTDLLIVVRERADGIDGRIGDSCLRLAERYGVALSYHVADLAQLQDWDATRNQFWQEIQRDGIPLYGKSLWSLRRLCQRGKTS